MISTNFIVSLSLISAALANPLVSRQTCKPNFQGNAVSVYHQVATDSVLEWAANNAEGAPITLVSHTLQEAQSTADFLVEFTGQPSNTYHIKLVADTQRRLAATAGSAGQFTLQLATSNGSQDFAIDCRTCSTGVTVAQGCVVSHPTSNTCVTGSAPGNLYLTSCDGSAAQTFDFSEAVH